MKLLSREDIYKYLLSDCLFILGHPNKKRTVLIDEIDFLLKYIENILDQHEKNRVETLVKELRECAVDHLN